MYGKADDFLVHQTPEFLIGSGLERSDHYDRHFFQRLRTRRRVVLRRRRFQPCTPTGE